VNASSFFVHDAYHAPPAQLTIRTKSVPCELIVWQLEDMAKVFRNLPQLKALVSTFIAHDLSTKIKSDLYRPSSSSSTTTTATTFTITKERENGET
jgi:hypothetical protein